MDWKVSIAVLFHYVSQKRDPYLLLMWKVVKWMTTEQAVYLFQMYFIHTFTQKYKTLTFSTTAQTHVTLHISNCAFLQLPKHMLQTFYNKMDANIYKNIPHHLSPWHSFMYLKCWEFLVSIRMHPTYKTDFAVPSSCNTNIEAMSCDSQHN